MKTSPSTLLTSAGACSHLTSAVNAGNASPTFSANKSSENLANAFNASTASGALALISSLAWATTPSPPSPDASRAKSRRIRIARPARRWRDAAAAAACASLCAASSPAPFVPPLALPGSSPAVCRWSNTASAACDASTSSATSGGSGRNLNAPTPPPRPVDPDPDPCEPCEPTASRRDGRSATAVAAAAVARASRPHSSASPLTSAACAAHRSSARVSVSNRPALIRRPCRKYASAAALTSRRCVEAWHAHVPLALSHALGCVPRTTAASISAVISTLTPLEADGTTSPDAFSLTSPFASGAVLFIASASASMAMVHAFSSNLWPAPSNRRDRAPIPHAARASWFFTANPESSARNLGRMSGDCVTAG